MLAIGLCTSTIMLLLQAFAFDLYQRIALLVPIVITNWFVLARLDRAPHGSAFAIGNVRAAFGAAAALVIVGAVCEAIGHGTLLAGNRRAARDRRPRRSESPTPDSCWRRCRPGRSSSPAYCWPPATPL